MSASQGFRRTAQSALRGAMAQGSSAGSRMSPTTAIGGAPFAAREWCVFAKRATRGVGW